MTSALPIRRITVAAAFLFICSVGGFAFSAALVSDLSVEDISPRIKQVSFTSNVLGAKKNFCVVLPTGYSTEGGDWPWIVLLHGRGRHERSLIDDPQSRKKLLTSPFVVVLPDGDNSWYVDSQQGRYEEYLAEVLGLASARFGLSKNPSRRAITGWSMGGYGCIHFVQSRGGIGDNWQFSLLAPIIGLSDYPADPESFPEGQRYPVRTEVFGTNPAEWKNLNPMQEAKSLQGMSILLVTGDRAFDRTMNEHFSSRLNELGIEHELKILPGFHSLDLVRAALPLVIARAKEVLDANTSNKTNSPIQLELVDVKKIWDRGAHNAFTDMVRFDGRWYVAFREASSHGVPAVGKPGGKVRVIRSDNVRDWESAGLLDYGPNQDVRDAKLSITPDGRLMLLAAAAPHAKRNSRQSLVWFSKDGQQWAGPKEVGEKDWWLWRVAWAPNGMAYGIGYGDITTHPRVTRLYRSCDGINFQTIVRTLTPQPETGETGLIFRRDGAAVALVRQDGTDRDGKVGIARGDYTDWSFKNLGVRIGGPALIELPSGHLIAATRIYDGKVRTSLSLLDPEVGKLTELLTLPSGGDTSYPGLVWYDKMLWVSYYSSHEGKTSIYLARVKARPIERR